MKTLLQLFILLLVCNFANAQTVQWASNRPGVLNYQNHNVATDSQGNVYTLLLDGAISISKLDASGNLVWAKQLGASPLILSHVGVLTIDTADNVYFSGQIDVIYGQIDFDMGSSISNQTLPNGIYTNFIEKIDASGNFVWAKTFNNPTQGSGNNEDAIFCLKTDVLGNVFATGSFSANPDFDPNVGIVNLTATGSPSNFIIKLDSLGSLVWVKSMQYLASSVPGGLRGYDIDVDSNGNVITLGAYTGLLDLDPGVGVHTIQSGIYDSVCQCYPGGGVYISKLNSSGDYVWGYDLGGNSTFTALYDLPAMVVDSNNNIIITSDNGRLNDFDFGPNVFTLGNSSFVLKIDTDANFLWAKTLGVTTSSSTVAVDSVGNIYSGGSFSGLPQDFDPGAGTFLLTPNITNLYISKLDANGNFVWAQKIGNANSNLSMYSLSVAPSGKVNVLGRVIDGGFNRSAASVTPGAFVASYTQPALATTKFELNNNISIYPNPSTGNFTIAINENLLGAKVAVYNLLGQKVTDFKLEVLNTNQNLDKGMYLIEIEKEGNSITKKIIVN